ncbi:MAG TPA: polysaccharide deacetylase family protein [Smithella sp.]|nr:polysaccharide deacetylase family protein [Smithella sp.]
MNKKYIILSVFAVLIACLLIFFGARYYTGHHASLKNQQAEAVPLKQNFDQAVTNYRKIIVLLEGEDSLDAQKKEAAVFIAKHIYDENREILSTLEDRLSSDIEQSANGGFLTAPLKVDNFLNELEKSPQLHDVDKLVFLETVDLLSGKINETQGNQKIKKNLSARLEEDLNALHEIRSIYDKEMSKILAHFETRGMAPTREKWDNYVAFLKTKFNRDALLKEYQEILPKKESVSTPISKKQFSGYELPPKTLVLTFDDGPHPKYTEQILDILKQNGIKAVFFEIGQNVGKFKEDNKIQQTKLATISRKVIDAGCTVANHSYTHSFFPKLSESEMSEEIEKTNKVFDLVIGTNTILFRPPYGAQDEKLFDALEKHNMKSVIWNIDSRDWADPIPSSVAQRVLRTVQEEKRGIILFHDIHKSSLEALPTIIESLKKDGYTFASWNGSEFVTDKFRSAGVAPQAAVEPISLYRENWAVIIGIDKYEKWPKLQYAVNDAQAVRDVLIKKYRFKPENIYLLLNEEATRERILSVLGDTLGNTDKIKKDDRVFVFFAGHGATRQLPSGRYLGYIVPVNADLQNYEGQAISMTNFQDISETIPARHVFFVMDSCYSGLGLTRGGGFQAVTENYLKEISRRFSRQMLTAGGMDEQVADNGPNGHSVFTWTLLQGLEGKADLNGDGYITASELAAYLAPSVSSISKQTPSFGNLPGSEGGEFIFDPQQNNEFLSELSTQLDEEAIQLNSQLDKVRKQIAEKKTRNDKLRKDLASAQMLANKIDDKQIIKDQPSSIQLQINKHMEKANALFKEKKYKESLDEFLAVNKLNASSALVTNNIGYIYYKMGQYEESLPWFEKTNALDPRRSIAYANIAESYFKLNRKSDAKKALEKYLELAPNSRYAAEIAERLKAD